MSAWRAKALELFPEIRSVVESAPSIADLWVELAVRFQRHYTEAPEEGTAPTIRATCLYAVWCTGSTSRAVNEAASIEFYEYLPEFALALPEGGCKQVVRDIVTNIGTGELKKMGCTLNRMDLRRFQGHFRP